MIIKDTSKSKENKNLSKGEIRCMLDLSEALYVGKGRHKKCYVHPEDGAKCIKMSYSEEGETDLQRELEYLKILRCKKKDYSVLPQYYGTIETNLGTGYVYERVINFDGSPCKTLEDFFDDEKLLAENFDVLAAKLCQLKMQLLDNEIITMGLFPENIIVQMRRNGDISLRVINDMGSAALIPLEYYFTYVAKIRINKRWKRFCQYISETYQSEIISQLIKLI